MGLFRCRYQANQRGGNFCIGEIQREHCVFTFLDVGQLNFRIVGISPSAFMKQAAKPDATIRGSSKVEKK